MMKHTLGGQEIHEIAAERDRLAEALVALVDRHHVTLTGSKYHDPQNIDWPECPCKTCAAVAQLLPERAAEALAKYRAERENGRQPLGGNPESPRRGGEVTLVETAIPFAVRDRSGYWLHENEHWGDHAHAQHFDTLDAAWDAVATFQTDLWDMDGAFVCPWPVAEGYRAIIEPCIHCGETGRRPEDNPYHRSKGFTEHVCLSCWGYGATAIIGLSTVQLSWGGLFDGRPHDSIIHLVRSALAGGSPGPLLCGIDFRAEGGPGYSVGGGCSGPGWENVPCSACVNVARDTFPEFPVFGSVGGAEIAALLGVANGSTWDFRRPWREESNQIKRNRWRRAVVTRKEASPSGS